MPKFTMDDIMGIIKDDEKVLRFCELGIRLGILKEYKKMMDSSSVFGSIFSKKKDEDGFSEALNTPTAIIVDRWYKEVEEEVNSLSDYASDMATKSIVCAWLFGIQDKIEGLSKDAFIKAIEKCVRENNKDFLEQHPIPEDSTFLPDCIKFTIETIESDNTFDEYKNKDSE